VAQGGTFSAGKSKLSLLTGVLLVLSFLLVWLLLQTENCHTPTGDPKRWLWWSHKLPSARRRM
jgi:hypothetical protein